MPTDAKSIRNDSSLLKERFGCRDNKGSFQTAVYVVNEKSHPTLTVDFLAKLFELDSEGRYDIRTAKMGPIQQGGDPTPSDRIRGILMAEAAIHWLDIKPEERQFNQVAVGLVGGKRSFMDLSDLNQISDTNLRLPVVQTWLKYIPIFELTSGMSPTNTKYQDPQTGIFKSTLGKGQILV